MRNADAGINSGPYPRLVGAARHERRRRRARRTRRRWSRSGPTPGWPETATASGTTVGPAMHSVYADARRQRRRGVVLDLRTWATGRRSRSASTPAGGCDHGWRRLLLDVGICSTHRAADFFGLLDGNAIVDGGAAIDLAPPSDSDLGATGGSDGGMKIDNNGADGGGTGASPSRGCNCAINGELYTTRASRRSRSCCWRSSAW